MLRLIQPYLPLGLSGLMMCWMLENNNGCVFDKITKRYNFISKQVLHIHSFLGGFFQERNGTAFLTNTKNFFFSSKNPFMWKVEKMFPFSSRLPEPLRWAIVSNQCNCQAISSVSDRQITVHWVDLEFKPMASRAHYRSFGWHIASKVELSRRIILIELSGSFINPMLPREAVSFYELLSN